MGSYPRTLYLAVFPESAPLARNCAAQKRRLTRLRTSISARYISQYFPSRRGLRATARRNSPPCGNLPYYGELAPNAIFCSIFRVGVACAQSRDGNSAAWAIRLIPPVYLRALYPAGFRELTSLARKVETEIAHPLQFATNRASSPGRCILQYLSSRRRLRVNARQKSHRVGNLP